jgi:hypothetical protein
LAAKNVHTWKPLDAVSMSTDQTSEITDIKNLDNVGYIISWAGASPVGTVTVEVSNDKEDEPTIWHELDFGASIEITGNSGSHDININQLPFSKIRIKYNRTSGSGTLTAAMTMKQVGG